jgi:hypothetical protein
MFRFIEPSSDQFIKDSTVNFSECAYCVRTRCIILLLYYYKTQRDDSYQKKVKVEIKFTLEQAMKAQRGSRGVAVLFL